MDKPEVIIEIDVEGNPKISVNGCAGPSCADLTRAIEKALGSVTKDTKTREFHETTKDRVSSKQ